MKTALTFSVLAALLVAVLAVLQTATARRTEQGIDARAVDARGMAIEEELVLDRMFIHSGPVAVENTLG